MLAIDLISYLLPSNSIGEILLESLGSKLVESYRDKLNKAKESYTTIQKDTSSPLEYQRSRLLGKSNELQTKIMLYITQQVVLLKLLAILADQTINIYDAKTEQDLKLVEMSLGQIDGFIARFETLSKQRKFARTLAIVVSIGAFIILGLIIYSGTLPGGPTTNTVLPILQIPLPILLWSAIGSFAAILYRFNKSGDIELQDPLRWLFTRPLTGLVMGIVGYLMLSIGFLAAGVKDTSSFSTTVVFWLTAFISGFSDRFADTLLRSLVGHFGGDDKAEIVTLDAISSSDSTFLTSILDGLPSVNKWLDKRKKSNNHNYSENVSKINQKLKQNNKKKIVITKTKGDLN